MQLPHALDPAPAVMATKGLCPANIRERLATILHAVLRSEVASRPYCSAGSRVWLDQDSRTEKCSCQSQRAYLIHHHSSDLRLSDSKVIAKARQPRLCGCGRRSWIIPRLKIPIFRQNCMDLIASLRSNCPDLQALELHRSCTSSFISIRLNMWVEI